MNKLAVVFYFILIILSFWACEKEHSPQPVQPKTGKGVFIVNQGNFQFSNSSISYYNPSTKQVENNIFQRVNDIPLGDVAQSMIIKDSLGFIVLNNSGKIYIININTFEFVEWITNLTSPRYIYFINNKKAYITDLYAKLITIFNPETFQITGNINVDNGNTNYNQHATEQMVQIGNKLYVNCWSFDNKILIIDTEIDKVIDSITVGIQPVVIASDKNDKLWVLTDGGYSGNSFGHEKPELICINPQTKEIEKKFVFDINDRPVDLKINGTKDTLYFINNDIWQLPVEADVLPENPFINKDNKLFFALGIDPVTSDVYVSDAIDYMQPGMVYRFSAKAEPLDTVKAGIIPGFFCFK